MLLSTTTIPFSEMSIDDKFSRIFLYVTISLVAIIAIIGFFTKKYRKENMPSFSKYAIGILVGYSITVICSMFFFKIDAMVTEGYLYPLIFYPILVTAIVGILLAVIGIAINLIKPEIMKKYSFIGLGIITLPVIASIVCISIYYVQNIKDSEYYENVSNIGLIISAIALIVIIVALALIFGKKRKTTTKSIVYASVSIALAFALSYIRMFKLPQGGSVTLACLLPIIFYSYMFGIRKGVLIGSIFGILQAIQDPWIIHPAQFFLDYIIAFGAIGLAGIFKEIGIFKNNVVLSIFFGGLFAGILRYFCHVTSGIFAFSCYAEAGYGAIAWGFLYNLFVFVDLAICLGAGVIMCSSKSFAKMLIVEDNVN
ncbi:MAG: energy-coupled thiamine transporter ThiT [Clostridia bacterium]